MNRYILAAGLVAASAPLPARAQTQHQPALVVLIVVDQMRGDYLDRYAAQWTGGFKRFRETGTFFPHGRQDHASTETAPGHSTILSGREPAHTGIILNNRGVQDPTSPALGVPDPQGSSPRRFQGTTLYDWLVARDPDTRVLSVSRKDRGAIFPVGRGRGSVYWYLGGQFTTSRYYSDTLPPWVTVFNSRLDLNRIAGSTWNLLLPESAYAEPDSFAFENAGSDFTFPHQLPGPDAIAKRITSYPVMDSLTLAFALTGVEKMGLGRRGSPDLLVVSLSTTDAIGHAYGPDSREIHDQLLHVDRWLGQFLDSLGVLAPGGMVAVLTGDHGIVSLPEYAVLVRHQRAGRVGMGSFPKDLEAELEARYHVGFDLSFDNGLLSADVDALRARGVNVDSLAGALAARIQSNPGVAQVFTPATLMQGPDTGAAALWRRLIPSGYGWLAAASVRPGYVWSSGGLSDEHGSGNAEDIEVPIAFFGSGVPVKRVDRPARTVDIGPTLAALLGVKPTEALDGVVLQEVVRP
ncbi:MAG TPA: alkaline phosphatase family protein [Gemmatimonadales bacterium]|nr:alkaline phosphatase family protein [Gemmatimonadales bacterium]